MRLIRRVSCNKLRAEGAGQNVGQEGRGVGRKRARETRLSSLERAGLAFFLLSFFIFFYTSCSCCFFLFLCFCFCFVFGVAPADGDDAAVSSCGTAEGNSRFPD